MDLDYQLASSSSGEAGWLTLLRMGSLEYMILDANPTRRHPSSFYSVHFPMQRTDPSNVLDPGIEKEEAHGGDIARSGDFTAWQISLLIPCLEK